MGSLSCSSKRNKGWQVKGIELWGRSITLGCSCLLNSALSLGSLGSGEVCVQSEAALAPQRVTVPVPSWSLHVVPGAGSTWHCCCPHRVTVSPVLASAPWPRREVTSCHQVNVALLPWILVPFVSDPLLAGRILGFCAPSQSCAAWLWLYTRTDPNIPKFKNFQLLCLVPVQVLPSGCCCSHCPSLSCLYLQICNLCLCVCRAGSWTYSSVFLSLAYLSALGAEGTLFSVLCLCIP